MGLFDFIKRKNNSVSGYGSSNPNTSPTKEMIEDKWVEKSNEGLKKSGSHRRVINVFTIGSIIIILLVLALGEFSYFVLNDYFKPTFIDNSTCTLPEIPACPVCPTAPACPSMICNLTIPTKIDVSIKDINFTGLNNSI
jgi:hypothetical protein